MVTSNATKVNGARYYYVVKYHEGGENDKNYNEVQAENKLLPWYELYVYRNSQDAKDGKVWKKYTKIDTGGKLDIWSPYWKWNERH